MINLKNWYVTDHYEGTYIARGYVFGHHRLQDGMHIRTSQVMELRFGQDGDCLLMDTRSGSHYELRLSDIRMDRFEETSRCLMEISGITLSKERCLSLTEEAQREALARVDRILEPEEIFFKLFDYVPVDAYYKDGQGKVYKIQAGTHTGMFCDSYLINDWEREVDFRYMDSFFSCQQSAMKWSGGSGQASLPTGGSKGIRPYTWSDTIKAVKIENARGKDLVFIGKGGNVRLCRDGEITCMERTAFWAEGVGGAERV